MDMEYEYREKKRSLFFGLPLSFTTYTLRKSISKRDCFERKRMIPSCIRFRM